MHAACVERGGAQKHDSGLSSCSADYHDNETDDSIDVGVPASSSPQPSEQSKVSNSIGGEPPFTELKKETPEVWEDVLCFHVVSVCL